jgi:hypothetical protein
MVMVKVGVNQKCICGSGIKYKKCCINKQDKFKNNDDGEPSEKIKNCINKLIELHPTHTIINISNNLNETNYREYQLKNFTDKIIMIAEKNITNGSVFFTRVDNFDNDIIVMYHGSYRTFQYKNLDLVIDSVSEMII